MLETKIRGTTLISKRHLLLTRMEYNGSNRVRSYMLQGRFSSFISRDLSAGESHSLMT